LLPALLYAVADTTLTGRFGGGDHVVADAGLPLTYR
jgi:hypothetical protein